MHLAASDTLHSTYALSFNIQCREDPRVPPLLSLQIPWQLVSHGTVGVCGCFLMVLFNDWLTFVSPIDTGNFLASYINVSPLIVLKESVHRRYESESRIIASDTVTYLMHYTYHDSLGTKVEKHKNVLIKWWVSALSLYPVQCPLPSLISPSIGTIAINRSVSWLLQ